MAAGVTPDVFCGDADTASEDSAQWARAHAKKDIRFPKDKYATDLSIAFDCAEHEARRRGVPLSLTLTCASGGRPDHFLGVIGQLAIHSKDEVYIVDDADGTPYEGRVLRGGQTCILAVRLSGRSSQPLPSKKEPRSPSMACAGISSIPKCAPSQTLASQTGSRLPEPARLVTRACLPASLLDRLNFWDSLNVCGQGVRRNGRQSCRQRDASKKVPQNLR